MEFPEKPIAAGQEFQPEIRRARIDKLTIYEISDSELDLLEKGMPRSIFLNFAILLLSVAVSFTIALCTSNVPAGKVFTSFLVVLVIGYVGGFLLLILWLKDYQSASAIVCAIRKRLPPEGEPRIPVAAQADALQDDAPLEILSAYYGSQQKRLDVKRNLSEMIKGGKLTVTASNQIAGDPHPGVIKILFIKYLTHGKVYSVEIVEGRSITLP